MTKQDIQQHLDQCIGCDLCADPARLWEMEDKPMEFIGVIPDHVLKLCKAGKRLNLTVEADQLLVGLPKEDEGMMPVKSVMNILRAFMKVNEASAKMFVAMAEVFEAMKAEREALTPADSESQG